MTGEEKLEIANKMCNDLIAKQVEFLTLKYNVEAFLDTLPDGAIMILNKLRIQELEFLLEQSI